VNGLALLGWSDPDEREVLTREELVARFDLGRVNKSAAVFDEAKLRHLNREHLKAVSPSRLASGIAPYLQAAGRLPAAPLTPEVAAWAEDLAALLAGRIDVFSDAVLASDPVFLFDPSAMDEACRSSLAEPGAAAVARAFESQIAAADLAEPGAFKAAVQAVKEALGVKGRALFHPIRIALTAAEAGPDMDRLVPLLERGSRLALPAPVLPPLARVRQVLATL
jgi:nondiscriminating glutamyl-tRNA synthetase